MTDCDELFCNANLNLYDCPSISPAGVAHNHENDILYVSNVLNSTHAKCHKLFSDSMISEINSDEAIDSLQIADSETTRCHLSCDQNPPVSAFPELQKFRRNNAKQMVLGHLNINSLRNKFF
jgi:hypothetical protein